MSTSTRKVYDFNSTNFHCVRLGADDSCLVRARAAAAAFPNMHSDTYDQSDCGGPYKKGDEDVAHVNATSHGIYRAPRGKHPVDTNKGTKASCAESADDGQNSDATANPNVAADAAADAAAVAAAVAAAAAAAARAAAGCLGAHA